MDLELRLYQRPVLTNEVKPGQVLEALPGSIATCVIWQAEPSMDIPSNVFGYVRGELSQCVLTKSQGDTIVERVFPFGKPYIDTEPLLRNTSLREWSTKGNQVYLAIGELTNADPAGREDFYSPAFRQGSVSLPEEQVGQLRELLLDFIKQRGKKDYVFKTPDGQEYSLNQIVLGLKEK